MPLNFDVKVRSKRLIQDKAYNSDYFGTHLVDRENADEETVCSPERKKMLSTFDRLVMSKGTYMLQKLLTNTQKLKVQPRATAYISKQPTFNVYQDFISRRRNELGGSFE